ncbi:MAG: hypothetical protein QOC96_3686 [Acidobacteriota bacterium]|nr:hypothetical protein [Acidobacteriota bacterium]
MKRNVLGVAPGIMQDVEHPLCANVVERMDDDERVTLAVWMSGEPSGDGVTCALVVWLIGKVVLVCEIVIEKYRRVFTLCEPCDGLFHITRQIENV